MPIAGRHLLNISGDASLFVMVDVFHQLFIRLAFYPHLWQVKTPATATQKIVAITSFQFESLVHHLLMPQYFPAIE